MRRRLGVLLSLFALRPCLLGSTAADCPGGDLVVHRDNSFETARCWTIDGIERLSAPNAPSP